MRLPERTWATVIDRAPSDQHHLASSSRVAAVPLVWQSSCTELFIYTSSTPGISAAAISDLPNAIRIQWPRAEPIGGQQRDEPCLVHPRLPARRCKYSIR